MDHLVELRKQLRRRLHPQDDAARAFLPAADASAVAPAAVQPAPRPVADSFLPPPPGRPSPTRPAAAPAVPLPPLALAECLPGEEWPTSWGACYRIRCGLAAFPGQRLAPGVPPAEQPLLADLLALPPGAVVYLDLETCGLNNAPLFLCGLATTAGDTVQCDLLLARDLREEPSVLCAAAEVLAAAQVVVTFNGLGFDVPLLLERARYFGVKLHLPPRHVDLLPLARQCYRRRYGNCRLQTLEQHVCGWGRTEAEIASRLIPRRYREYCAGGDGRLLQPIVYHNARDLAAMVDLVPRLSAG